MSCWSEQLKTKAGAAMGTQPSQELHTSDMADIPSMRIVTLGKTGSGKSSLINTLCGEKKCIADSSANSGTQLCQSVTQTINGTKLQLVDTPGFFDTDKNDTALKDEMIKCIVECAPGPHAFLLVLKVERFTSQEEEIVDRMMELFSEEVLKFTTVVFTHGDQLDEGVKIEEWVKKNKALKVLVQKCGGRCHVIDNKYWSERKSPYRDNQYQIEQLLQTINQTVRENKGECYTNEMLLKVQMMKEKKKRIIKHSSPGISEEEADKKANESVFTILKRNWKGVTVGGILGAFLGRVAGGAIAAGLGASSWGAYAAAGVGGVVGAALGGLAEELAGGVDGGSDGGPDGGSGGGPDGGPDGGSAGGAVSEYYESVLRAMRNKAKILLQHLNNPAESYKEMVKLLKSD